jgi:hypothetical protein
MSSHPRQSLGELSRKKKMDSCYEPCDEPCDSGKSRHYEKEHHYDHGYGYGGWGLGGALLLWIILTVVIWLILIAVNPVWLRGGKGKQKGRYYGSSSCEDNRKKKYYDDDCVDYGRAFLAAIVIGFIITVILYVIYAATRGYDKH